MIASGVAVASCEADSDESLAAPPSPNAAQNEAPAAVELSSGPAARALRAAFPDHADRVLGRSFPMEFVANEPGFARPPSDSMLAHVDVQLPRDASRPMTITARGGFEIRVREIDASGEATPDERAVTYRRAGGTAFWTVTEAGAEEWLHLAAGAVSSMEDVAAAWEIEGAKPVAMNGAVALMDGDVARAWVTAKDAYTKDGRAVDVRLDVRDGRIELFADARGEEVLIDPGWVAVAPNVTGRMAGALMTLATGKALLAAGYTGAVLTTAAELYDPVANTWSPAGNMTAGRYLPGAALLPNGRVIVLGGQTFAGYVATAELYNPALNTWSAAASMAVGRGITNVAPLVSGKVLVAGGYGGVAFLTSAEVYDSALNTWSAAGSMATARGFAATVRLQNGKVLVAGGENGNINTPTALASAELYDPATNTWSAAGSMTTARFGSSAALLPSGKIIVAGGFNTAGDALTGVEIYDPATNTWSAAAPMTASRAAATGTLLGTGQLLVAGGASGAAAALATVASTEIYNPAANTWAGAGNLTAARYLAHSSVIDAADALVVGGTTDGVAAINSVNRYYTSALAAGTACGFAQQCASGFCVSGVCCQVAACAPSDQCHNVGTCQPVTGVCSNPNKPDGTSCNDNSVCSPTDVCQAGTCTGLNPITCNALDQCHDAGICNPATGICSNPNKIDGSTCDDGNFCTSTDTCSQGACLGSNPVTCTAADQCHDAGTCDPASGVCSNPNKANGTACNDGDLCTQTDTCMAGACTGNSPVMCMASDQCHDAGTCDPMTGACSNPNKADGATCDDGDLCTQTDTCSTGACKGDNPVTCTASDQCHDAGTCDPATGTCDDPEKADGTACDDGDACTQTDACSTGACTGASPVTCAALDECHDAGMCDSMTGVCDDAVKPDGTPCSIGTCQSGNCTEEGTGGTGGTGAGGTGTGATSTGGTGATSTGGTSAGGSGVTGDSGCGCRLAGSDSEEETPPAALAGLALAAFTWARRRKQARS